MLALIGEQFKNLPFTMKKMDLTLDNNGGFSGTMTMEAVGN